MRTTTYFRQFVVPPSEPPVFEPLGAAEVVEREPARIRLQAGTTLVEVSALAPDLFRVGMFGSGRPVEYTSEAVLDREWTTDGVESAVVNGVVQLTTGAVTASVQLDPPRVWFEDAAGCRFAEDDPSRGMGFLPLLPSDRGLVDPMGSPVRVYKTCAEGERYFGCGERTGGLEKTGSHQVFWNVDPPTSHTASLNNLYTSIPFVLSLRDGQGWGLFFDNSCQVEFDLGAEDPHLAWFGADGGDLVYYVFAGPTPRDVLRRYTDLTGRTPMPPLWALGNHQSRWGYRTADDLREVARQFRERDIPCDALYLDIDYMDGYRVFTWDGARFPDPRKLLADLAEQGFRVVTIVDPGVKVDEQYAVYQQGRAADLFCRTFTGSEYHNVVWPGVCAFPDFTSSRAREWWGSLLTTLLEQGVAGIWCDMNEPTGFVPTPMTLPPDVVHPGDGSPRLHAQVHNLYGSLMARATREALQRQRPCERPFVISRAGFAGLQRHALHWTGDNSSWWEHLWMSMPQLQNLGLSGLAWVGVDVGGFAGDATGELVARWTEFGIFQPFCRNHSSWDTHPQEPWAFGEPYESVIRDMLQLRQRLIPYLYTLFEECHRTGAPILRPLLFTYPDDPATYATDDQFLVGDDLLIAPIARPGAEYHHVYLPRGTWFHWWSGKRFEGPTHILAHAPLGQPAIYARGNVPIPLWPAMRFVGERTPDPLSLVIFPTEGEDSFTLYEDAGDGYEHEQGSYARTRVTCEREGSQVRIRFAEQEGRYRAPRESIELELRAQTAVPAEVRLDGTVMNDWRFEGGVVRIPLAASPAAREVVIRGE